MNERRLPHRLFQHSSLDFVIDSDFGFRHSDFIKNPYLPLRARSLQRPRAMRIFFPVASSYLDKSSTL